MGERARVARRAGGVPQIGTMHDSRRNTDLLRWILLLPFAFSLLIGLNDAGHRFVWVGGIITAAISGDLAGTVLPVFASGLIGFLTVRIGATIAPNRDRAAVILLIAYALFSVSMAEVCIAGGGTWTRFEMLPFPNDGWSAVTAGCVGGVVAVGISFLSRTFGSGIDWLSLMPVGLLVLWPAFLIDAAIAREPRDYVTPCWMVPVCGCVTVLAASAAAPKMKSRVGGAFGFCFAVMTLDAARECWTWWKNPGLWCLAYAALGVAGAAAGWASARTLIDEPAEIVA